MEVREIFILQQKEVRDFIVFSANFFLVLISIGLQYVQFVYDFAALRRIEPDKVLIFNGKKDVWWEIIIKGPDAHGCYFAV